MLEIMTNCVEEMSGFPMKLLEVILKHLTGRDAKLGTPAYRLAVSLLKYNAQHFKKAITEFFQVRSFSKNEL